MTQTHTQNHKLNTNFPLHQAAPMGRIQVKQNLHCATGGLVSGPMGFLRMAKEP